MKSTLRGGEVLNKVLSGKALPQFLQGPLGQTAASESQILL